MKNSRAKSNQPACYPKPGCIAQAVAASLRPRHKTRAICALSLGALLSASNPLLAATFTVMNTDDTGTGSLRDAIDSANANPDTDDIVFNAAVTGTIALTSGALDITNPVTITGPGASNLTVQGNNTGSVFFNGSDLDISGLTITGGNRNSGGGFFNAGNLTVTDSIITGNSAGGAGGGIYNSTDNGTRSITINNSTVSGNSAGSGGGIFNSTSNSTTTITINNSTVSGNNADRGGGLYSSGTGPGTTNITINDSTIDGNTAAVQGGGILNKANGDGSSATLTVNNSTISGNSAILSNLRDGGGIYNYAANDAATILNIDNSTISGNTAVSASGIGSYAFYGTANITINNSTITGNTTTATSGNHAALYSGEWYTGSNSTVLISNSIIAAQLLGPDCVGFSTSLGYNLDSDGSCLFTQPTDLPNTTMPFLGSLANNGGPTFTHALLDGSPAIDTIPMGMNGCGTTHTTDQRGIPRPRAGYYNNPFNCDIGAFERTVGTSKMGDYVWQDTDGDGTQDAGEPGLAGVTVNLRIYCDNDVLTTTTDSEGAYRFDYLPTANYQLAFTKPAGYSFSPPIAAGDYTKDSNADPVTGLDNCRFLDTGQSRPNLDAGLVPDPDATGLSVHDLTVDEDDGTAQIEVTLNPQRGNTVTVKYATKPGSALAGQDFRGRSGTLTFAPGETSQFIPVPLIDDNVAENTETFITRLFTPTNASITDDQATITINDDDGIPTGPVSLSVQDLIVPESAGTASVVVELDQPGSETVTVKYATKPGTALPGEDFRGKSGLLTFNPGETMKTVPVTIISDQVPEVDEEFILRIFTPVNATISDDQGTVTIYENGT